MNHQRISEYAGLRRELEIGLRIAPTRESAVAAAKSMASYLDDDPTVAVRLAGVSSDTSRVTFTLAICLGTTDEIKAADATSRAALNMIQRIVESLSAYDPSFVTLPHAASPEARLAAYLTNTRGGEMTSVVRRLAASV
jgi:hypothetical protein